MDTLNLLVQSLVVLLAIVLGVRAGGVGIGLWGAVGTAGLTLGLGVPLGTPPVDALLIIVAVIVTTSTMQACGGIDAMVLVAARLIARRPRSITVVAPVVSLLLAALAGTSNIVFSLLPVVQESAQRAGVRPVRPLAMSVVATSVALGASPVSAAMAAMVTVMEGPAVDGWGVVRILSVTLPAALVGTVAAALVVQRLGPADAPSPTVALGGNADGGDALAPLRARVTRRGQVVAALYLCGVAAVVALSLAKAWRPAGPDGDPASVASIIQLVMLATGALIALVGRPAMDAVPRTTIFQGGMVAAIAFFGLAWMLDTYLAAHSSTIGAALAGSVGRHPWVMTLAVFAVAVLTTSQSTATRMILPIALAGALPTGLAVGLWVGALGGIYLLPTNGLQIAAASLDTTGSTRLGTRLVDNSFFVPSLVLTVTTSLAGAALGWALG